MKARTLPSLIFINLILLSFMDEFFPKIRCVEKPSIVAKAVKVIIVLIFLRYFLRMLYKRYCNRDEIFSKFNKK